MLRAWPTGDAVRDAEWGWVRSLEAMSEGVKLALLVDGPVPRASPSAAGEESRPVLLSYPRRGSKGLRRQRLSVEEFLHSADELAGRVREILLPPRPALGKRVELLLQRLVGFQRELPGQINGFWIPRGEPIPSSMPSPPYTGAVLPPQGKRLGSKQVCLALVMVEAIWLPLYELKAYAHEHSADLIRHEERLFVPCDSPATPWPTVYVARLERLVDRAQIAEAYGPLAQGLARHDQPSLELRLTRRSS